MSTPMRNHNKTYEDHLPEHLQQESEEYPQMTPWQEVQQNAQCGQFFEVIGTHRRQKDKMQHGLEHILSFYPCVKVVMQN